MRSGRNGARGFGHAAEHDLHPKRPREYQHLVGFAHACAFHQFDVDAAVDAVSLFHIGKPLYRFVAEDRHRASFGQPRVVVDLLLGHRLLDQDDAFLLQPV